MSELQEDCGAQGSNAAEQNMARANVLAHVALFAAILAVVGQIAVWLTGVPHNLHLVIVVWLAVFIAKTGEAMVLRSVIRDAIKGSIRRAR